LLHERRVGILMRTIYDYSVSDTGREDQGKKRSKRKIQTSNARRFKETQSNFHFSEKEARKPYFLGREGRQIRTSRGIRAAQMRKKKEKVRRRAS